MIYFCVLFSSAVVFFAAIISIRKFVSARAVKISFSIGESTEEVFRYRLSVLAANCANASAKRFSPDLKDLFLPLNRFFGLMQRRIENRERFEEYEGIIYSCREYVLSAREEIENSPEIYRKFPHFGRYPRIYLLSKLLAESDCGYVDESVLREATKKFSESVSLEKTEISALKPMLSICVVSALKRLAEISLSEAYATARARADALYNRMDLSSIRIPAYVYAFCAEASGEQARKFSEICKENGVDVDEKKEEYIRDCASRTAVALGAGKSIKNIRERDLFYGERGKAQTEFSDDVVISDEKISPESSSFPLFPQRQKTYSSYGLIPRIRFLLSCDMITAISDRGEIRDVYRGRKLSERVRLFRSGLSRTPLFFEPPFVCEDGRILLNCSCEKSLYFCESIATSFGRVTEISSRDDSLFELLISTRMAFPFKTIEESEYGVGFVCIAKEKTKKAPLYFALASPSRLRIANDFSDCENVFSVSAASLGRSVKVLFAADYDLARLKEKCRCSLSREAMERNAAACGIISRMMGVSEKLSNAASVIAGGRSLYRDGELLGVVDPRKNTAIVECGSDEKLFCEKLKALAFLCKLGMDFNAVVIISDPENGMKEREAATIAAELLGDRFKLLSFARQPYLCAALTRCCRELYDCDIPSCLEEAEISCKPYPPPSIDETACAGALRLDADREIRIGKGKVKFFVRGDGTGYTYLSDPHFEITPSFDPFDGQTGEYILLTEKGISASITPFPLGEKEKCRAEYNENFVRFTCGTNGLKASETVFALEDAKVWHIELENKVRAARNIEVCAVIRYSSSHICENTVAFSDTSNSVIAQDVFTKKSLYFSTDAANAKCEFETDRRKFDGNLSRSALVLKALVLVPSYERASVSFALSPFREYSFDNFAKDLKRAIGKTDEALSPRMNIPSIDEFLNRVDRHRILAFDAPDRKHCGDFSARLIAAAANLYDSPGKCRGAIVSAAKSRFVDGDLFFKTGNIGIKKSDRAAALLLPLLIARYKSRTADESVVFEKVPLLCALGKKCVTARKRMTVFDLCSEALKATENSRDALKGIRSEILAILAIDEFLPVVAGVSDAESISELIRLRARLAEKVGEKRGFSLSELSVLSLVGLCKPTAFEIESKAETAPVAEIAIAVAALSDENRTKEAFSLLGRLIKRENEFDETDYCLVYIAVVDKVFGCKICGDKLYLNPKLPEVVESALVEVKRGEEAFRIDNTGTGKWVLTIDGVTGNFDYIDLNKRYGKDRAVLRRENF